MKKNLLLAAVAVLAVGQVANAAGARRDGKTDATIRGAVKDAKADATRSAGHGADSASTSVIASVRAAKFVSLDPVQEANLGRAMSENAEIMTAAKEAVTQAKSSNDSLRELAAARVTALANLRGVKLGLVGEALANLSKEAQLANTYWVLATKAGKSAESWDKATLENLTFLLVTANNALLLNTKGLELDPTKAIAEAMTAATELIAKSKEAGGRSVRLNLNDVNKFCI